MAVSIRDIFGHWHVTPSSERELAHADVILAHEFGDQREVSSATRRIVETTLALHRESGAPIICQYPGNLVLAEAGVEAAAVIAGNLANPGGYLDTEEVNRQVAALCVVRGWRRVAIATHPHHLWRAGENLKHHGLEPLYPDLSAISYDSSCAKRTNSSALRFVPREILARILYLSRGWLV